MSEKIHAKFRITGSVQGVGYRYFVYTNAQILGLSGFAKNHYDGSVEVAVEGDELQIANLLTHLKKGPFNAYIEDIKTEFSTYKGIYNGFNIK